MVGASGAGEARENEQAETEQQDGLAPDPVGDRAIDELPDREAEEEGGERKLCAGGPRIEIGGNRGQGGQIHVRRQRTEGGKKREDRRHGEGVGSEHGRMARPKRLGCHPRAPLRVRSTVIPGPRSGARDL